jgi:predicted DNA-binding transcriptional regulator AlpA
MTPSSIAPVPGSPSESVVFLPEILRRCACSSQSLRRWIRKGKFPAPIKDWPGGKSAWSRLKVEEFFLEMTQG